MEHAFSCLLVVSRLWIFTWNNSFSCITNQPRCICISNVDKCVECRRHSTWNLLSSFIFLRFLIAYCFSRGTLAVLLWNSWMERYIRVLKMSIIKTSHFLLDSPRHVFSLSVIGISTCFLWNNDSMYTCQNVSRESVYLCLYEVAYVSCGTFCIFC